MLRIKRSILFAIPIVSIAIMIIKPTFILRWNTLFSGMALYLMVFVPLLFVVPGLLKTEKFKKRSELILAFAAGSFFIFGGLLGHVLFQDQKNLLIEDGILVVGEIVDKKSLPSKRRNAYNITIKYQTSEQIQHRKTFIVNENEFVNSEIGQNVEVLYSVKDYKIAKPIFNSR